METNKKTDRQTHLSVLYVFRFFFTRKSSTLCCKGSCQFTHIDTRRRRRFCILNRTRTIKMQKAKTNHDSWFTRFFFTVSGLYSHLHFRTLNLQFSIRTTSWSRLPTTYRSSSTTWNQVHDCTYEREHESSIYKRFFQTKTRIDWPTWSLRFCPK